MLNLTPAIVCGVEMYQINDPVFLPCPSDDAPEKWPLEKWRCLMLKDIRKPTLEKDGWGSDVFGRNILFQRSLQGVSGWDDEHVINIYECDDDFVEAFGTTESEVDAYIAKLL